MIFIFEVFQHGSSAIPYGFGIGVSEANRERIPMWLKERLGLVWKQGGITRIYLARRAFGRRARPPASFARNIGYDEGAGGRLNDTL